MKIKILLVAGLMLSAQAAVTVAQAAVTPGMAALQKQFETEATLANVDSADADEAFKYGDGESGCGSLKLAADDYGRATDILRQIRAAVENGADASEDPRATQLERLDAAIAQYQGFQADTVDSITTACE